MRFLDLPRYLYHPKILHTTVDVIGRTVKFDMNTQTSQYDRFARAAVDIDFNQRLKGGLDIDGEIRWVEDEGLPSICYSYGRVGHSCMSCPERLLDNGVEEDASMGDVVNGETRELVADQGRDMSEFSPWLRALTRA